MPFVTGAGRNEGARQTPAQEADPLQSLVDQAGTIVGWDLVRPPGVSDALWGSVLQTIITNGDRDFGRRFIARVFQGPSPARTGAFGNLTGDQGNVGGFNINIGGGDSGPSAAERRRMLRGQLMQSGFGVLPFDVSGYIKETVKAKGSFDSLVTRIVGDERFQNAMPGILDADGNLRMSPRDWKEQFKTYQEVAAQQGVNLNKRMFGVVLDGNVTQEEFVVRTNALATFRANKAVFVAFNEELKSRGLKPLSKPKDVLEFLTKKKPKAFYSAFEEASITAAARRAGVEITPERAARLARRIQGIAEVGEVSEAFNQAIQSLQFAGPELLAAGLSEAEVQNIALGLAPASNVRKAERVLRQREAEIETRQVRQGVGINPAGRPVLSRPSVEPGA